MNDSRKSARDHQCVEAAGPWPFITRCVLRFEDGTHAIWSSRHHRKGLVHPEAVRAIAITETLLRCLWMPWKLNWWIGTIFALGSSLFMIASILCLSPPLAEAWSLDSLQINAIFFSGSIPFTTAAYLQLFQAANAGDFSLDNSGSSERIALFGWRPHDIGWLGCALQFVGTILFNFNTFDVMLPSLNWFQQDLLIWVPNIVGSILFLASGYMAFIETCHAHWGWKPKSISWWVVFIDLLGCVGFMLSAVFAIFLPGPENTAVVTLSITFTLLGAIGFLVGALLMLPEMAVQDDPLST